MFFMSEEDEDSSDCPGDKWGASCWPTWLRPAPRLTMNMHLTPRKPASHARCVGAPVMPGGQQLITMEK
jgi:hypothetical protein